MPWKETTKMEEREEFIVLWKSGKYSITNLAEMFNISRPTAYKYVERFKDFGMQGLLDMTRGPKFPHNKTPNDIEKKIIKLREKHKRWGGKKLQVLLAKEIDENLLPKVSTINLILKRNGLVKPRKRRCKVEPKYPIFNPSKCNQVWSADFKGQFRLGNKKYCYPLTIADSYSRYVFSAKGMYNPTRSNSKTEFRRIFRIYGLPKQMHTDNGQPFASFRSLGRISSLSSLFMELGIQPVFSDPGKPGQNGRHERMHEDLKGEVTNPPSGTMQPQQRRLNSFVKEYNELRPHESLNMRTPRSVHEYSEIPYPEKIPEWYYPGNYKVRRVTNNGAVRIGKTNWLFISTSFAGKEIGFEDLGNRVYRVFFRQFFLGYADMKELKIYDIMKYEDELHL